MSPTSLQNSPLPVEFVLQNEKGEELYNATFKTSGDSRVISISLPPYAGLPPLQVGKNYQWYFSVICNQQDRSADLVVEGWIQRIPLNTQLSYQLRQATPENRAQLYAEAEIWQDALTTLVDLRRSNPNNLVLEDNWKRLLKSVKLDKIANDSF